MPPTSVKSSLPSLVSCEPVTKFQRVTPCSLVPAANLPSCSHSSATTVPVTLKLRVSIPGFLTSNTLTTHSPELSSKLAKRSPRFGSAARPLTALVAHCADTPGMTELSLGEVPAGGGFGARRSYSRIDLPFAPTSREWISECKKQSELMVSFGQYCCIGLGSVGNHLGSLAWGLLISSLPNGLRQLELFSGCNREIASATSQMSNE